MSVFFKICMLLLFFVQMMNIPVVCPVGLPSLCQCPRGVPCASLQCVSCPMKWSVDGRSYDYWLLTLFWASCSRNSLEKRSAGRLFAVISASTYSICNLEARQSMARTFWGKTTGTESVVLEF